MPSSPSEDPFAHRFGMRALIAVWAACLLAACSSPKEVPKDVEPPPWAKSDTKAAVDSLTTYMLRAPGIQWLQRWKKKHEGSPTLIVGPIVNMTTQFIDEDLVGRDLKTSISKRSIATDDSIQVLWEKAFLCSLRPEHTSQCGRSTRFIRPEEMVRVAKERGADFMLIGAINASGSDPREDEQPDSYTVILKLFNTETKSAVWLGEKKIKRVSYWGNSSPRLPEDSESCDSVARMRQC